MRKYGFRHLIWLSLMLLAGLSLNVPEARTQSGFLSDYTFGFYGTSREESRMGREDIIAREGYCPTGGCVLRLDKVEVRPNRARRGATLRAFHHLHHSHPGAGGPPGGYHPGDFLPGEILGKDQKHREPRVQRHQDPGNRFHLAGQRRARHLPVDHQNQYGLRHGPGPHGFSGGLAEAGPCLIQPKWPLGAGGRLGRSGRPHPRGAIQKCFFSLFKESALILC